MTGGLSGDGARFQETLVFWDDEPEEHVLVALGCYGSRLKVGYGSLGGWDPFGPERLMTRANGNVLYELDGNSALDLYHRYLGAYATGLPATGLRCPLGIRTNERDTAVVRTILSVNDAEQSMTFAGDVPEGAYARFMKANVDRLIDGAAGAAKTSDEAAGATSPDVAVLVSCIGRTLALKQRTEEEVEGVREGNATQVMLAGLGLLRNMLNINMVCAKHFGQSITCVALPNAEHVFDAFGFKASDDRLGNSVHVLGHRSAFPFLG